MDSFYYLLGLIGVVWLVLWTIRPPRRGPRRWAPFDMRESADDAPLPEPRRWHRQQPEASAARAGSSP